MVGRVDERTDIKRDGRIVRKIERVGRTKGWVDK